MKNENGKCKLQNGGGKQEMRIGDQLMGLWGMKNASGKMQMEKWREEIGNR